MEITENGRKKVLFYRLDEIKIKRNKKWDDFWRVMPLIFLKGIARLGWH